MYHLTFTFHFIRRKVAVMSEKESSKSYINTLSKQLLGYIFSFLTLKERCQVEIVCKHWKTVSLECPCFSPSLLKFESQNISVECFENTLKRCGSNVVCLELVDLASSSFPSDWLEIIAISCPKLESLNFQISRLDKINPRISPETLNLLSERCKQLKQLNLKRRQFTDDGVKYLFKNCQLQAINFIFNQSLKGECFKFVSDKMQCILLHGCWSLTVGLEHIQLCKNLHYLDISNCRALKSATVTKVLQSVGASLTELRMGENPQFDTEVMWSIPCHCRGLKSLNLFSLKQVKNDFLASIAKSCIHLKTLSINKTAINDTGLFALRDMISLRNLAVAKTQVTDVGLFALSKKGFLEKLVVSHCANVGDPGCIAVIRNCTNLKEFDVSYCSQVTDATVDDALQVRKLSQQKLVVNASETSIENAIIAANVEFYL